MRATINRWLYTQIENPDLFRDGNVIRFSMRLSCRAVLVANVMVVIIHLLLDGLRLLPYPLFDALIVGLSVSTATSAVVTYMFGHYMGIALREICISRDEFATLSATDTLTGLMNRRAFFDLYEKAEVGSIFVIFDVDRFKNVNDVFGHAAGDLVIRAVGKTLLDALGPASRAVARLGGEEFAVLFAPQMGAQCAELVDRARTRVAALDIDPECPALKVTISGGIAEIDNELDAVGAYKAADRALYIAKAAGRNRIVHVRDIPMVSPQIDALAAIGDGKAA